MVKERLVLKKEIKKVIYKILYTIIIFLLGMISIKIKPELKSTVNNIIYKDSPNYLKTKQIYKKYFGEYFTKKEEQPVFTEKLSYKNKSKYKNGVKLKVDNNYIVPTIESGIIIYLENNKMIISQIDGINVEYSNIKINNYKLYDYIEKSKPLGEVISDELIITFEKEGKYLDYKKYL